MVDQRIIVPSYKKNKLEINVLTLLNLELVQF